MSAQIRATGPNDLEAALDLLQAAGLPADGVAEYFADFSVATEGIAIVGVVGLEVYPPAGLLRSLAVAREWRGQGLGQALVGEALEAARRRGLQRLFLLTQTAADYFPRFGFREVSRTEVDVGVQESVEVRSACPQSANCMRLDLEPKR